MSPEVNFSSFIPCAGVCGIAVPESANSSSGGSVRMFRAMRCTRTSEHVSLYQDGRALSREAARECVSLQTGCILPIARRGIAK